MNKRSKTSLSIGKIAIITVLLIALCGAGRMVIGTQINNVKIILSDDCEINAVTNKTKVADILEENHIIILDEENVFPNLEDEIGEDNTIKITKNKQSGVQAVKIAEKETEMTMTELINGYAPITEKIVVEEEVIPYETITKDISGDSDETKDRVIQEGKDGLKEVTYKVKYQNDIEIEKILISEEIIEEPVDKIVQVQNAKVSTRSAVSSRDSSGTQAIGAVYKVTAYCSCAKCCGKTNGITASGTKAQANHTVAAPASFAIGTKLLINGQEYVVEDRGGAITGNKIDVYMNSHAEALAWGVKYLTVQVVD